jgi:hypothetical protein
MSVMLRHWAASGLGIVLLTFLSACVVPGGGYERSAGVAYGVNYYEPSGHAYGGWAPGYKVGPPPRGGDPHPSPAHYEASPQASRAAAPSRPTPSIPTRSRPAAEHGKQ